MDRYTPGIQDKTPEDAWVVGPINIGKRISFYEGELIVIAFHNKNTSTRKKTLLDELDGFAGNPGVYYHMRHLNEFSGKPYFYAGQAHDLKKRGADGRVNDKNIAIFIKMKKIDMDENWKQHLEYLMIYDLKQMEADGHILVENTRDENPSNCRPHVKTKISSFFEDMKKKLTEIDVWCKEFAKAKKINWASEKPVLIGKKGKGIQIENAQLFINQNGSSYVRVMKGSHIRYDRGGIDNSDFKEKQSMITNGTLEESSIQGELSYRFTRDCLISSKTRASAICLGKNTFKEEDWDI